MKYNIVEKKSQYISFSWNTIEGHNFCADWWEEGGGDMDDGHELQMLLVRRLK